MSWGAWMAQLVECLTLDCQALRWAWSLLGIHSPPLPLHITPHSLLRCVLSLLKKNVLLDFILFDL